MRETHVPFESVWSELLKKDQSGHRNLWKTTTYIKFDLLENLSQITYRKTVIAFVLGNHRIRDKYVPKNTFTHSE